MRLKLSRIDGDIHEGDLVKSVTSPRSPTQAATSTAPDNKPVSQRRHYIPWVSFKTCEIQRKFELLEIWCQLIFSTSKAFRCLSIFYLLFQKLYLILDTNVLVDYANYIEHHQDKIIPGELMFKPMHFHVLLVLSSNMKTCVLLLQGMESQCLSYRG